MGAFALLKICTDAAQISVKLANITKNQIQHARRAPLTTTDGFSGK